MGQTTTSRLAEVLGGRTPGTKQVTIGLVGRGIGASLSPRMHEAEGQRHGLDYRYVLLDFDTLGLADADLAGILHDARTAGFAGLNVTFPFKQAVLPLLDHLADDARAIGAVNTVVFDGRGSTGHNTDCWGFAQSFALALAAQPRASVLQLGAGGAGAAVAHALVQQGVGTLRLFDSDRTRAETLASQLRAQYSAQIVVVDQLAPSASAADGIVNATPVGMAKYAGLPLPAELVTPRHWVADVVYFPLETALIAHARSLGCHVLPGGGMAVYQAVRSFALFTGRTPDAQAMAATFRAALVG